ncbi:MAG: hypothetical protein ABEK42_02470, partial [Thiohalorhabdaceae bacterium]
QIFKPWNFWTDDAAEVQRILEPFDKVNVLHGHVHQVLYNQIGNITFQAMMATAWPWPYPESYAQEAVDKLDATADLDLEWHFIGPIQSNKAKLVAPGFAFVHSVDRLKTARALDRYREGLPPLDICLQVNVSGEAAKSG